MEENFDELKNYTSIAYSEEIREIVDRIFWKTSVLVEVEKELTPYLVDAVLENLKKRYPEIYKNYKIVGANPDINDPSYINPVKEFKEMLEQGTGEEVFIFPSFDLIISSQQLLSSTSKILLHLLALYPGTSIVAFTDPTIPYHESIYNYFDFKIRVYGIKREKIEKLLSNYEKDILRVIGLSPLKLFKHVSGLSVIKFRRIMKMILEDRILVSRPDAKEAVLSKIRELVVSKGFEFPDVSLDEDIGGYEDVKKEIKANLLDILKRIEELEGRGDVAEIKKLEEIIPRGIIFYGPPGTGKTLFAKAIATEINGTIFIVSGPELKSKFYGESEANLRRIFSLARQNAPSVIVFDELDSIAGRRRSADEISTSADNSLVNQLLTELDGFRKDELVIFVGTTNFIENIDPAILRPGRVELKIKIDYPSADSRKKIVEIYNKKYSLNLDDELIEYIVSETDYPLEEDTYFTGDHLHTLMRLLKREQIRKGKDIDKRLIEECIYRISGAELISEEEKLISAVHEASHAIASIILFPEGSIRKISINVKSPQASGVTIPDNFENKYSFSKEELEKMIVVLLAGKCGEEIILGKPHTGAVDDIYKATKIAEIMVKQLGFSKEGPVNVLALEKSSQDFYSLFDLEVQKLLKASEERAKKIIMENKDKVLKLKDLLLEKEIIFYDDIKEVIDG